MSSFHELFLLLPFSPFLAHLPRAGSAANERPPRVQLPLLCRAHTFSFAIDGLLLLFPFRFHSTPLPLYLLCYSLYPLFSTSKHPPIVFPLFFRQNHPPNPSSLESASIPNLIRLFDSAELPALFVFSVIVCDVVQVVVSFRLSVALPIT